MNEARMSQLLGQLHEQLQAFHALLLKEQRCLVTWPVTGLPEIAHEKQQHARILQQLDEQCRQLLSEAGLAGADRERLRAGFGSAALWQRWLKTRELTESCHHLNEGNGSRLHALSQHTLRLLDIMGAGSTTPTMTYGRGGQYQVGSRRSAIGRA